MSAEAAGAAGPQSQSTQPSVAQGDGLMVGSKDRERQRKKRQRAKKKMQRMQETAPAAAQEEQAVGVTGEGKDAGNVEAVLAVRSGSPDLAEMFEDTLV